MVTCNTSAPSTTATTSTTPAVALQADVTNHYSPVYINTNSMNRRTSASVSLLAVGGKYLSQGKYDQAMSAFDDAFHALSSPLTSATATIAAGGDNHVNNNTIIPRMDSLLQHQSDDTPSLTTRTSGIHHHRKNNHHFSSSAHSTVQNYIDNMNDDEESYDEDDMDDDQASCFSLQAEVSSFSFSFSSEENTPVDTYHEDECDVGPRPFQKAFVPSTLMDVDVLQLIICYNQALVHHARKEYSLALQLYNFVTGTIGTTLSNNNSDNLINHSNNGGGVTSFATTLITLSLLAMRAHNNMGQIDYAERSEEQAMVQFETALGYARRVPDTSASNQLEIATILSNWCRVQWMLGRVDATVYQALEEILRIRFNHLGWNNVDVAAAHFNLGMAEYSRNCNEKALAHFMQYLQVSSHRLKTNKKVELDPIPGLIFVLLIKNDEKEDKMSQDLVWGLRTLQDKRQDLGPKNSEVASVLNFIGTLLFHQRELDHALLFFQEELRLEEQFVGAEDDVSVSVTCNNIGRILQELGRYPQAIYYYQRSLRHRYGDEFFGGSARKNGKGCQGKNCQIDVSTDRIDELGNDDDISPATMNLYSTVWYNLGLIHDKMGSFSEAISAFRMSLKLRRAMLGSDHSDVACLLYNIGVLQMEQQLLNEATDSFREALRIRRVASTGQLNDRHVVKTLQKLASLHKSKGNINGALEAFREVMQVLKASVDFDWSSRSKSMAMTLREIAELHHAEGNLQLALEQAVKSFHLLRSSRTGSSSVEEDLTTYLEQEAAALLLIGSFQHENCSPVEASATFAEASRLIHSALHVTMDLATETSRHPNAATLLPLFEVSTMLAAAHCAPEA
jgi:tetratricopeptide (TPR) repeat protein